MLEPWYKVLEAVVSRIEIQFVSTNVVKLIKDMPGLKNPFAKRKRGNRLMLGVAKSVGEDGMDAEPALVKAIEAVCSDNNYKFRRDGVIFLKEYFQCNKAKIIKSPRFREVYLPQLIDLINDEDMHIQLDAIEAFTEILEELTIEEVEKEFVPCVLSNLDLDNHAE